MKSLLYKFLFVCTTSLLFCDCKKEKSPSEIVLEYPILFPQNMEIDTLNVDSLIVRESYEFPANLEGELAKNNTSKSKIKSAKLIGFRIQVLDYAVYDSVNYSNLKDLSEIRVDIKNTNVGQIEVARKLIPDVRVKAVNLDLPDVEGKEYLKQDNFSMVFKYRKRRAMPDEMPFIISLKFKITADPL